MSDIKILFNGTELAEFDGKLELSEPNPSLIEEPVKCLYCQGVDVRGGRYSDDYKYATFFERDENKFTFGLAHPDGYTPLGKFKINYCPYCGRKLEE
ncbi:hypothetical protein [Fibrobacter sp.]|uniref:hypothetical protein n=1 Tax=Fibrobacter sp. TaxID=35828 RepID=UPI00386FD63D